jgi:hypothetical protein
LSQKLKKIIERRESINTHFSALFIEPPGSSATPPPTATPLGARKVVSNTENLTNKQ